jgi:hypothetical protein
MPWTIHLGDLIDHCPSAFWEASDQAPGELAQLVHRRDENWPGALRVPAAILLAAQLAVYGVGEIPKGRIPQCEHMGHRGAPPQTGARLESARPDRGGLPGIEKRLAQAIRRVAKRHQDFNKG